MPIRLTALSLGCYCLMAFVILPPSDTVVGAFRFRTPAGVSLAPARVVSGSCTVGPKQWPRVSMACVRRLAGWGEPTPT